MRSVLRALSLMFAVSVLTALTYQAGGGGCRSQTVERPLTSSQHTVAPVEQRPPVGPEQNAPAKVETIQAKPAPPPPPDRFLGASKAGPVFLPSDIPNSPAQVSPQPQANKQGK